MTRRHSGASRHSLAMVLTAAVPLLAAAPAHAKILVQADGPGGMDTYALLGQNFSIETPDCGHHVPHITEAYDDVLKKNVFVFHLHVKVALDDDRCGGTDRQRTEIRGKGEASANEGETVYYRWKFKLPAGFQTSPNFCHIMQIKSNDGAPIMTLTPRNNSTISMDGRLGANGKTALTPFIDTWMVATMKVTHADNGSWELTIRRISDGAMTFHYAGTGDTWDANTPQDPKWGIYRSLTTVADLRDEDDVRFADFCISKVSAAECEDNSVPPSDASVIGPPPPSADAGTAHADAAETPPPPVTGLDASSPLPPPPAADASAGGSTPPGGGEPTPPNPGPVVPPKKGGGSGGCSCTVGTGSERTGGGAIAGLLIVGVLALRSRRRR
jgi:MYXO-CTERM domain-containing protein